MRKPILIIFMIMLTIVVLSVVHVAVANRLSTTGISLSRLQQEINAYGKENSLLHEEVLKRSSLTYIKENAAQIGFISTTKSNYFMPVTQPLALR